MLLSQRDVPRGTAAKVFFMKIDRKIAARTLIIILPLVVIFLCGFIAGWKIAISIAGILTVVIGLIIGSAVVFGKRFLESKHQILIGSAFNGVVVFVFMISGFFFNFIFSFKQGITISDFIFIPLVSGMLAFIFSLVLGYISKSLGRSSK